MEPEDGLSEEERREIERREERIRNTPAWVVVAILILEIIVCYAFVYFVWSEAFGFKHIFPINGVGIFRTGQF